MAVKNGMPYLIQAVESILGQSYKNFKFIIINDNSEDDTIGYLKSISDERLKIFQNPGNGLIKALNYGIKKIDTEYFAIMDADDISSSNRLRHQIEFLENNYNYGLVGCQIKYFINDSDRTWTVKLPSKHLQIVKGLQMGIYVLSHPTIFVRTEIIKKIGGYREDSFPNPDYDLYIRIIEHGKLANLNNEYCGVRLHEKSHTALNLSLIIRKSENEKNMLYNSQIKRIISFSPYLKIEAIRLYKKGIVNILKGKRLKGFFFLITSAFLAPGRALFYLWNKLDLSSIFTCKSK
jgi:glycosyltransferase involved in cell wall biosynthesis